jgi:hypothetical protein
MKKSHKKPKKVATLLGFKVTVGLSHSNRYHVTIEPPSGWELYPYWNEPGRFKFILAYGRTGKIIPMG